MASARQKQALTAVLDMVEAVENTTAAQSSRSCSSGPSQSKSRSSRENSESHSWAPKNMIVRGAFQELTNMPQQ